MRPEALSFPLALPTRSLPPRGWTISTLTLIILIILLIAALPAWPHSASWGYYPSGGLGLLFIIVAVLLLLGYR